MTSVLIALLLAGSAAAPSARPEISTAPVEYRDGDVLLEGFVAWDPALSGRRPAVMVVHAWKGLDDEVRERARMLARLGYVAFACDMYGKGVYAKDHAEAAERSGVFFGDRSKMRARAQAGLDALRRRDDVDPNKLAVMGYCFGGTASLECARAGFEGVRGVASFHGNLTAPVPAVAGAVKARVAVYHGAEDKSVNPGVLPFQDEMRAAKVDWQFVSFGGAVHSFTMKSAGTDPSKSSAYDPKADRRSWDMLKAFLAECFE